MAVIPVQFQLIGNTVTGGGAGPIPSNVFLLDGRDGGQIAYGGTQAGDNLALFSTTDSTRGKITLEDILEIDSIASHVRVYNKLVSDPSLLELYNTKDTPWVTNDRLAILKFIGNALSGLFTQAQITANYREVDPAFDPDKTYTDLKIYNNTGLQGLQEVIRINSGDFTGYGGYAYNRFILNPALTLNDYAIIAAILQPQIALPAILKLANVASGTGINQGLMLGVNSDGVPYTEVANDEEFKFYQGIDFTANQYPAVRIKRRSDLGTLVGVLSSIGLGIPSDPRSRIHFSNGFPGISQLENTGIEGSPYNDRLSDGPHKIYYRFTGKEGATVISVAQIDFEQSDYPTNLRKGRLVLRTNNGTDTEDPSSKIAIDSDGNIGQDTNPETLSARINIGQSSIQRAHLNLAGTIQPSAPQLGDIYRTSKGINFFTDSFIVAPSLPAKAYNLIAPQIDNVYIFDLTDFPAPVGGKIYLEPKNYIISNPSGIFTPFPLVLPLDENVTIEGNSLGAATPGMTLFETADIGTGLLLLRNIILLDVTGGFPTPGTATLFDINAITAPEVSLLALQGVAIRGFGSLGSLVGIRMHASAVDIGIILGGLTFNNNVATGFFNSSINTLGIPAPFSFLTYLGTQPVIQINANALVSDANQTIFNFDSALITQAAAIVGNTIVPGNGVFAAGSKRQDDIYFTFRANSGLGDSRAAAYFNSLNPVPVLTTLSQDEIKRVNATYITADPAVAERFTLFANGSIEYIGLEAQNLEVVASISGNVDTGVDVAINFYFARGNTLNTITSFADAGGGQVTVSTSLDHVYSNGDRIIIEDTVNYNGEYTIANVTANTFEITATFVATETGSHYQALIFTKASNGFDSNGRDKNTSLNFQVTDIQTNDVGFLCVENISGGDDWETVDIQVTVQGG